MSSPLHPRSDSRRFWITAMLAGAMVALGLGAAHYMESHGHVVTGMGNEVVWGLPHVFAIFMIVAASGVLNVASIGSVFGQPVYKARAPLSGLLSIALLAGGLMVLMLDLGRPDRLIIAATHINPTSVFALNVFLYSGMVSLVALYLWTMFERRMNVYTKAAGMAVLVWRFMLTTGTGSIFAFVVARPAYGSALLAPMFIVLSFGWGMAVFLPVQSLVHAWAGSAPDAAALQRLARLLGVFVAASLFMVAVLHLTHVYHARQGAFEAFLLRDGGVYPLLFWGGYVALGSVLPMVLLFHPRFTSQGSVLTASAFVVLGAFAWLYTFIIGGEVFPLEIFPGHTASSTFGDGQVALYQPTLPELLLGLGGVAAAFLLTTVGARVLNFTPHDPAPTRS